MRICPGTSRRRDPPVSELYSAMVCIFYEACLLIAILMLGACGGGPEKIPLHFSYITTKTGSFVAAGALPVVDLALEQINNRTDILPNYTLSYTTILDSKCNHTASLDAFLEHFRWDLRPTYVSLLCCGCSTADIAVAEVSHYWNVPQMAGIAAADELNDRQRFRSFFRTDVASEFVGPALAEMARQFNWTQMAIVSQDESLFIKIAESLSSMFELEQRVLDRSIIFDKNSKSFPYNLLHNLGKKNYRIIVLNAVEEYAYTVLCEAYYLGWHPPEYVWFIYSWYTTNWWSKDNGNNTECSPDILRKMLKGVLAIAPNNSLVSDDRHRETVSGLTPDEYEQQYRRRLQEERYQEMNLTEVVVAGTEFDAMWAIALGLHSASEKVRNNDSAGCEDLPGELLPLEHFEYVNDKMGCVLRKSFQQVSFSGITGQVVFNSNGSRNARVIRIQRYLITGGDVNIITAAEIVVGPNSSELIPRGDVELWTGGVPYDGAARARLHQNSLALVSIYSVAAITGIAFAVFCLAFNIIFRNKRVVKLSSRNLNFLIVAGATLLYTSVFLYIFSERDFQDVIHDAICNIRMLSFSLGYTLCFAVILAKTWRVYHIFFNIRPKKKMPKDLFLLVIIVVVVAVDILIIFIGAVVPTSHLRAIRIEDLQHPVSFVDGITYSNYVYICLNNDAIVWIAISYAYKGLLQLAAMFMAFHTRRVNVKILNDSKEIAAIVYINSIILALLAVVEFALSKYHEVYTALFGLALLLEATVFLTLVFIPKMVHLCKDPEGNTALDSSSTGAMFSTKNDPITGVQEVDGLKQQITELEKKLAEANKKEDN